MIDSNIFEKMLRKTRIFKNRDVLRHSYTPEYLPHRKEQIEAIASILLPALHGETPSNILIYGKTGTGKTATVKFVGRQLEEASRKMNVHCYVHYLNCEIIDTQYRVLATLAKVLGKSVPMTGWPTDQVYEELKEAIDARDQTIIIVLDEIDKLVKKGDDVLYNLSRINSELENARVSLIGISNDLKFKNFLDPRVLSSLSEEEIVFPPYNATQLEDILAQRAELAFHEGVLDEGVIPYCAALAAQEHGDARKALDLLRISGEIAEANNDSVVTKEHVKEAVRKMECDHIIEAVKTLPNQSKLVLYAMIVLHTSGKRKFTTGEVYAVYKSLCRKIGMDVLTQRRVSDLISELDMLGIINSIIISKGRYGRTREIKLDIPIDAVREVILDDYRFEVLRRYEGAFANSSLDYFG
ncbi:orc1/cdc6 family replication initiation protein [Geoglobus ahangari]|uniref:ORC1-type DNA replication protein n=1 Tax=Geoglobus ahangari TaxID=113653 RepID=A0A0F7IF87_9EURY|nr:ORC1-type DNA replication protein [Geoglobus ahangari]AKG91709.1 orc1/cdc6 family replication initiation protein [Geoglobus ahangari]NOY11404.1 ORC1-type DNA replication protein [Archaeoglobi archaeon]